VNDDFAGRPAAIKFQICCYARFHLENGIFDDE
jgi:hypothetical protein